MNWRENHRWARTTIPHTSFGFYYLYVFRLPSRSCSRSFYFAQFRFGSRLLKCCRFLFLFFMCIKEHFMCTHTHTKKSSHRKRFMFNSTKTNIIAYDAWLRFMNATQNKNNAPNNNLIFAFKTIQHPRQWSKKNNRQQEPTTSKKRKKKEKTTYANRDGK